MQKLMTVFLVTLAAHGLGAEGLDPWRGWTAFKEFAREAHEEPDPGVSVQFTRATEEGRTRLVFLRQVLSEGPGSRMPAGRIVCEFTFPLTHHRAAAWDRWSFDYGTFERFVDVVEQEPVFQDLLVRRPVRSAVYWEDAGELGA